MADKESLLASNASSASSHLDDSDASSAAVPHSVPIAVPAAAATAASGGAGGAVSEQDSTRLLFAIPTVAAGSLEFTEPELNAAAAMSPPYKGVALTQTPAAGTAATAGAASNSAAGTAALPSGWSGYTDPSGRPYYYNEISRVSTFERPIAPATAPAVKASTVPGVSPSHASSSVNSGDVKASPRRPTTAPASLTPTSASANGFGGDGEPHVPRATIVMNPKTLHSIATPNSKYHNAANAGLDKRTGSMASIFSDNTEQTATWDDQDQAIMSPRDSYGSGLAHREYVKMGKYESLDYHAVHNDLFRDDMWATTKKDTRKDAIQRVALSLGIGLVVGCVAFLIHFVSEAIMDHKYELIAGYLEDDNIAVAYVVFISINLVLAIIGTVFVLIIPAASGSGIPDVKGYLNGIRLPKAINVKTFLVKVVSTVSHVSSSLPVGPEGPMIHIGAMIGGGVSQPRSKTIGVSIPFTEKFCTDKDRRDFISLGAACGVSAAFGAPLGGILFALEEASSFWSQTLTWRTFLASMIATLTNNFFLSGSNPSGTWGLFDLNSMVVFNIGRSDQTVYRIWELIPFMLIGAFGGLMGAIFIKINVQLMKWRRDLLNGNKKYQLLEVIILSIVVSTLFFSIPFAADCEQITPHAGGPFESSGYGAMRVSNFTCEHGTYNPIASLMFTPQPVAVRNLFSRGTMNEFSLRSTGIFWFVYTAAAVIVAGSATSAGLLVPILLAGAAYGRFCGIAMRMITGKGDIDPGIYALIGASSFFAGVTRMTISLCVIMLEITNDLQFLPPIMLAVMGAKLVGDLLSHPLYDMAMVLKYVPFLEAEPSHEMDRMTTADVMVRDLKYFPERVSVGAVMRTLFTCTHNGFPVVDAGQSGTGLTLKGLILRKQLYVLIKTRAWENDRRHSPTEFRALMAESEPKIRVLDSNLSEMDRRAVLNLVPYMNRSPFSVHHQFFSVYAFRLFRSMGLRHLPVVNDVNDVVGMITRKDLIEPSIEARFRQLAAARGASNSVLDDDFLPPLKSAATIARSADDAADAEAADAASIAAAAGHYVRQTDQPSGPVSVSSSQKERLLPK